MPSKPETRGGKRPGAGLKPRDGTRQITRSVSMVPDKWDALDAARGELSRGDFVASDPRLTKHPFTEADLAEFEMWMTRKKVNPILPLAVIERYESSAIERKRVSEARSAGEGEL